jgi:hypothetical protein
MRPEGAMENDTTKTRPDQTFKVSKQYQSTDISGNGSGEKNSGSSTMHKRITFQNEVLHKSPLVETKLGRDKSQADIPAIYFSS